MNSSKIGAIVAIGLALALVTVTGAFTLQPTATSAANGPASAPATEPAGQTKLSDQAESMRQAFGQRESTYQQQIDQVTKLLADRQATYQAQLQELTTRLQTGQTRVNTLATQEQALQQQLAQLQAARNERLGLYKSQLAGAQAEYNARFAQYTTQLQDAQAKLAEANALLGR